MQLLLHDDLPEVTGERVFRHSRVAGFVVLFMVGLPAVLGAVFFRTIGASLGSLPWFFWVAGAPVILGSLFVWLLLLSGARIAAQSGLLPTNWVLRVSNTGIGVHLRSFQNAHFRKDVPTVLWLGTHEVARARRVVESGWIANSRGKVFVRKSWLELELQSVETAAIEKRIEEERTDQGPEIRVLGIQTRTRCNEMPVFFARPGVLRVELLGQPMLEALREVVEVAPDVKIDLDQVLGTALEPRVQALCARGLQMSALDLLRRERGLSLSDAKKYVEELGRKAA